ncbi:MAG: DUF1616 domain-containing protein [Candidatus Parvarchaeota archaeon]
MVKRDDPPNSISLDGQLKRLLKIIRESDNRSIEQVVNEASMRFGLERYEVARMLYRLKELGFIRFMDPKPPKSFVNYLFSSYVIWFWFLAGSITLTIFIIYIAPQASPFVYLRYIFGSLFVLYLPGAALIELLYPKPLDLSQLERLALSIGLSLALVPLVGLILNYTPWGIRLDPIVISLSMLTLAFGLGAVVRKFLLLKLELATRYSTGGD